MVGSGHFGKRVQIRSKPKICAFPAGGLMNMKESRGVSEHAAREADGAVYAFANIEVDAAGRRVFREGIEIELPPKLFDLLLVLVRSRSRLLSRDALLDLVWSNTVVADSSLTQAMSVLRREIGPEASAYIKTVPRVGYRLEAKVELRAASTSDSTLPAASNMEASPGEAASAEAPIRSVTRYGRLWAAAVILVVTVALVRALHPDQGNLTAEGAMPTLPPKALEAFERGISHAQHQRWNKAHEHFSIALAEAPDFAAAHLQMAEVMKKLGRWTDAKRHVLEVMHRSDTLAPDGALRARALSFELHGKWPEACILRAELAAANTSDAGDEMTLAECLLRDGKAHQADAVLQDLAARSQGVERWNGLLLLAEAKLAQNDYPGAIRLAQEVEQAAAELQLQSLRARSLVLQGHATILGGDTLAFEDLALEASTIFERLGDQVGAAAAEQLALMLPQSSLDPSKAESLLLQHLQLARQLGHSALEAHSLRMLSGALKAQGRFAESRALLEQSLAAFIQLGDRSWQGRVSLDLGVRDQLEGRFDHAEARTQEGLLVSAEGSHTRWLALNALAFIRTRQGRLTEALSSADEALRSVGQDVTTHKAVQTRCERAWTLLHLDRSDAAHADFDACEQLDGQHPPLPRNGVTLGYTKVGKAYLAARGQAPDSAQELLSQALIELPQESDHETRGSLMIEAGLVALESGLQLPEGLGSRLSVPDDFTRLRARTALFLAWRGLRAGQSDWRSHFEKAQALADKSDWSTWSWLRLIAAVAENGDERYRLLAELDQTAEALGDQRVRRAVRNAPRLFRLDGQLASAERRRASATATADSEPAPESRPRGVSE
jgi:DNA-binding winged helix-turn-helix (wHTH) protein/tetratricopeptide (TPR) repeat protein